MPRRPKKYHFLYKTTCLTTGRYYYGIHSTDDLEDGYLGSGRRLRYSVRKYGKEAHQKEVLEFFDDRQALLAKEAEVVTLNEIAKEDCMNIIPGGWCGNRKASELGNARIKELRKTDSEFNRAFIENLRQIGKKTKNLNPQAFKGRRHTDEARRRMSEKASDRIGVKNSQFGTCWIYNLEEEISKRVPVSDVDAWLAKGWLRGRKMSF